MKSAHVTVLFAAACAVSAAPVSIVAAQGTPTSPGPAGSGACSIIGYQAVFQAKTPAYLPGETARRPELGAVVSFPAAALGYDPATQRFTVAVAPSGNGEGDAGTETRLVELRRKHVVFEGDACPGQTESGGSIRCFEATTLASRGSNPVYCQRDKRALE